MTTNEGHDVSDDRGGPTLYLESDELDPSEAFCTEVFEGATEETYRVVQLTATQSFDSLRDALDVQLEKINDPSEAAVIITTPQSDDDSTSIQVGEGTQLYGFWVNPQDLTGISIAFSRLLERWEESEGSVRICLRDIESLLPYHDTDLIYRFLNTVLATLQGAGADVHAHFRPDVTDEKTLQMFESLFDRVIESDESPLETESEASPEAEVPATTTAPEGSTEHESTTSTTMSESEVDAFLDSEGHGVLAFAGESPYAIPMSYGYDADDRLLYMQLSRFDGSEKHARLDDSKTVSLVVSQYERPDQWQSVIVDGTLTRLPPDDDRTQAALDAFTDGELASVDVFNRELSEISFDWYVLEPSGISGRRSVGSL
jgi:nitroimidazol reductase NimA-like FMN-containing flavoprotein (pyridoxamine 5'-phosphate oxidase superfamily)